MLDNTTTVHIVKIFDTESLACSGDVVVADDERLENKLNRLSVDFLHLRVALLTQTLLHCRDERLFDFLKKTTLLYIYLIRSYNIE